MSNNRKVIAGMIAAAALAVSGSLVYAQPQQPGGDSGVRGERHGMTGHGMRGGHERHGQWSNPAAPAEGYLACLKDEFKITPAQEKALQTLSDKTPLQAES